jgi:ribonuclease HIII
MEFQGSPLLSNEISGYDINDEEKNESYTKEVQVLFQEISEDLKKLDSYNTGKVTENSLFNYLQSRLPQRRQLNVSLFQQLLQDVEREEGQDGVEIDIEDFTKKYIKAQQQLKLNFDTLKKGFDKERSLRSELEQKIQN